MIRSPAGFDGGDRIKRYLDYYQPSYGVMMLSAGQFSPRSIFSGGEPGAWYDPSDLTTMSQDAAGATPVTAAGQAVGRILDLSGRGNHATQSTAGARPILRQDANSRWYLEFDGVDDVLRTGNFAAGTDKAQIFLGLLATSTANKGLAEFGTSNTTVGGFNAFVQTGSPPSGGLRSVVCSDLGLSSIFVPNLVVDTLNVVTQLYDIAGATAQAESQIRVNGTLPTQTVNAAGPAGSGNFGTLSFGLGIANGFVLPGRIYASILRFGSVLDAATIAQTEAWVNGKTGAF